MQIKKQGTCGTYRSAVKDHTHIKKETIINNLDDDNP